MASIRERPTASGQPRYVVQYRHDGKQRTLTLTRERDAKKARDLINALGPDEALQRMHGAANAVGTMPTVTEWLTNTIDDLTGVTDPPRSDYRSLTARHIAPSIGVLDLDAVTTSDIAKWANALETKVSAKTIAN